MTSLICLPGRRGEQTVSAAKAILLKGCTRERAAQRLGDKMGTRQHFISYPTDRTHMVETDSIGDKYTSTATAAEHLKPHMIFEYASLSCYWNTPARKPWDRLLLLLPLYIDTVVKGYHKAEYCGILSARPN